MQYFSQSRIRLTVYVIQWYPPQMASWRYLGLAERLAQFRRTHQLSAATLARAAGISLRAYYLIENGKVMPSMETLERLGRATKLDPGWLGFGVSANGLAPHITFAPGFDSDSLISDLLSVLRGTRVLLTMSTSTWTQPERTSGGRYCSSKTSAVWWRPFRCRS